MNYATDPNVPDPIAGIQALLNERAACEERIKEINLTLQEVRDKIDLRTTVTARKPRVVTTDAPEPPAAA